MIRPLAIALCFAVTPALAGLDAITPIPGYQCAVLNASEREILSRNFVVPILAEPRADSPQVGYASALLIERNPANVVNGYVEILRLDGRGPAWVQASRVVPYSSRHIQGAVCRPAIMSNGKPGFGGL